MPVVRRDDSQTTTSSSALSLTSSNGPIYIAGICVGGALIVGLTLYLIIRSIRKRAQKKREAARGGAFLSVRGMVKVDNQAEEKDDLPDSLPTLNGNGFSRQQMTASVVLPNKAVLRPNAGREEIISWYSQSGMMPKPFSFAMGAGGKHSPQSSLSAPSPDGLFARTSFMSTSTANRFSVMSTDSSVYSDFSTRAVRKVRQLFSPVLPDELLIQTLGERLTVIQSFEDGWVLVGREDSVAPVQKSLFKSPSHASQDNLELGVIPAWCFLKPVKGLRAERPVRTNSLGITVQIEGPSPARDDIISWSNF